MRKRFAHFLRGWWPPHLAEGGGVVGQQQQPHRRGHHQGMVVGAAPLAAAVAASGLPQGEVGQPRAGRQERRRPERGEVRLHPGEAQEVPAAAAGAAGAAAVLVLVLWKECEEEGGGKDASQGVGQGDEVQERLAVGPAPRPQALSGHACNRPGRLGSHLLLYYYVRTH